MVMLKLVALLTGVLGVMAIGVLWWVAGAPDRRARQAQRKKRRRRHKLRNENLP